MRADRRTRSEGEEILYSDFDISFSKNPVTGSLSRRTNEQAVKGSIRNLILASRGEWAYHPKLGSKVYRLLFEPLDSITAGLVRDAIRSALQHEPRCVVEQVLVTPDVTRNGYDISIWFRTQNSTKPVEFKEFLRRVR